MAQLYDSAKVRQAADEVRKLADALRDGAEEPSRRAMSGAEQLQGRAAEALRERLLGLQRNTDDIWQELEELSRRLEKYASELEAVDEHLKTEMQRG